MQTPFPTRSYRSKFNSNIEHSTSNIQHPTERIDARHFDVGCSLLNVRCSIFLLTLCMVVASALAHGTDQDRGPEPFPSATPKAVVEVTGIIFPSVVRLDVAQEIYSEGKRTVRRGIGSGVIIDDDGRILTNFHVAGRAAEIFVTLFNKERVPAKLIGDDHWTDLAVVQMDMDHVKAKKIEFKPAELGESKGLIPGQDVMAIGTPFGLARTMTLGIVSNNERTFYPERMTIDEYETGEFSNWIQMDTPINPGNSGGPLVDLTGKVVGINTRGGGQNLNFAIPIDTAREVIAKILASATKDERPRRSQRPGNRSQAAAGPGNFLRHRHQQRRAGQQCRPQLPG